MDWSYIAGYFDGEGTVRFKAAPSRPDYVLIGLFWANTHHESLEAMQAFMGCGSVYHTAKAATAKKPTYKRMYQLKIERVEDILRVGEAMLPLVIIKRDALREMLTWAKVHRKPAPVRVLAAIGVEEITRLYRDEKLTQRQIADRLGVTDGAISSFFLKHAIKGRRRGPQEDTQGILATFGHDKLQAMYESGMTCGEIAEELGVRAGTVYMHFYTRRTRLTKPIRRARAKRKQEMAIADEGLREHLERQEMRRQLSMLDDDDPPQLALIGD